MRKIVLSAAFLGFASAALAQTYSVEPGLWEMKGAGVLAGIDLPLDGTECLSAEDAEIDVAALIRQSGDTRCEFDHRNGRDFSMSCEGATEFSASGDLKVDRRQIVVDATGTVNMDGAGELPASISATLNHIGACPAQ